MPAATDQSTPEPDASEPGPGLPGLLAIDHVGLAVADLDEAIAFHTDVLGLELLHREDNVDADVHEAMLGTSAGADAAQVQLLAPGSPESPIARFLERSGPGLQQLAYRVADLEESARALRSRGLRLLYDSARTGTRGSRINFVHPHDTGGVLVELVEPPQPFPPVVTEGGPERITTRELS
jgi:methylmalonyl-CoA/ethylmalonyl-CoA epimerase